jgi:electron transport complex protein RnfG
MRETVRLITVPTAICVAAGLLLAEVKELTRDPIERATRQEIRRALESVLPPCDNRPDEDPYEVVDDGIRRTFYVARARGRFAGVAFESGSPNGYGGEIRVMVGVDAAGAVTRIRITSHRETPGLGSGVESDEFRGRFEGRDVGETNWCRLTRDDPVNGRIHAVTGATISSRAVTEAVRSGIETLGNHRDRITAAKEN